MQALLKLVAAALSLTAVPAAAQIAQVETTGGTVKGVQESDLSVFKGMPYAAPPVGELRWKAPQPVVKWQGVRDAGSFGAACMQDPSMLRQMGSEVPLSEDCLFADVWSPAKSPGERLPVIVWIHGGGYNAGAPSVQLYDGAQFAHEGVVFVSVAYRLGPFGFLATPQLTEESGEGSGNYGMRDMIAGLEWVRDNIAAFGGDPAKVTIMGHSAGSSAVSILAASPRAAGLFRGVIAESGANFAPPQDEPFAGGGLFTLQAAEQMGDAWLASLGATTLAEARALPAQAIDAGQRAEGAPGFRPAVDGYVLPGDQYALWQAGSYNGTPLLVGVTSDETSVFGGRGETDDFPAMVRAGYGEAADAILAAYTGERAARDLANDTAFVWNAYTWARLQDEPVFAYWFHDPDERNPNGSGHGSEVALVFGNEDDRPGRAPWSDRQQALSKQLQSYWVNFAKGGDPNGEDLPDWPQFESGAPSVLEVGAETKVIDVPGKQRLEALDAYYDWRRGN